MAKPRFNKTLRLLLKLLLSGLAIYVVVRQVDVKEAATLMLRARPGFLILATALFAASKALSAQRLLLHFRSIGLHIGTWLNLRLYLLGMYYNLFLPGGIGGDGYKAWWLNKYMGTGLKSLASALLLDRVNGLAALVFLAFLGGCWIPASVLGFPTWWIALPGLLLLYPVYFFFLTRFFSRFSAIFLPSNLYSLGVQLLQLLCMGALLLALKVEDQLFYYGIIFLISSMVAVLPLTIGGIGAREIVFLIGAEVFMLQQDAAVAVSVLFFLITALVSLSGAYYAWLPGKLQSQPPPVT